MTLIFQLHLGFPLSVIIGMTIIYFKVNIHIFALKNYIYFLSKNFSLKSDFFYYQQFLNIVVFMVIYNYFINKFFQSMIWERQDIPQGKKKAKTLNRYFLCYKLYSGH